MRLCPCSATRIRRRLRLCGPTEDTVFVLLWHVNCYTSSPSPVQLGCQEGLPEQATEEMLQDDSFLKKFHHALLEVHTYLLYRYLLLLP